MYIFFNHNIHETKIAKRRIFMKRKLLLPVIMGMMLLTACSDTKDVIPETEFLETTVNEELDMKLSSPQTLDCG